MTTTASTKPTRQCSSTTASALLLALLLLDTTTTTAFSVAPQSTTKPMSSATLPSSSTRSTSSTQLAMGLFDGVKDAFSAPALERSVLDAERETPIDRWFGWSVQANEGEQGGATAATVAVADDDTFVDSMDGANYVSVELVKPMGIVFEENDAELGGIFVQSLKSDSPSQGLLEKGDQLVAVGTTKVAGLPFDDALGAIVDDASAKTKLLLFRGSAQQLYGPTGASQEWLDEFITGSDDDNGKDDTDGSSDSSS